MRQIVTIVNVGLNLIVRFPNKKKQIEHKNIQIYLVGVRWFSEAARKQISECLKKDWPGYNLTGYALNREMHPKRIN